MPHQAWVIGNEEHLGLAERGNAVLDKTPIASFNGASVTNAVMEMRQGMLNDDLTGTGFTGPVLWIGRFITNAGVEEIWASANNNGVAALARKVSGTWSPVAFSDMPVPSDLIYMQGVGMNGKFFLAYNSDVNRLHVWDGTSVRRVGMMPPAAAPTVALLGAGSLAFTRWYRQRNLVQTAGIIARRSEPSPSVSGTVTAHLGIKVTPSAATEGATHWELEASVAAVGPWYRIGTAAAGVAFDDTNATIPTANPSKELGSYDPPPSAKYLSTDGMSLMMAGAWETVAQPGQTPPKQNRVWFTPPLGSSDIGDDERISNTLAVHGWTDVGDAGPVTALQGPVYGETYGTKKSTVFKLTPTGNVDAPYALSIITNAVGCVDQRLMTMGEVAGTPAVLFADSNAVYALTASGGITCLSEAIGVALRGLTITSEPGLLIYDPLERTLLLQTSHAPSAKLGSYRSYMFDCFKRRWEGFELGGATGGWILGVSQLGIDNVLGGGGTEIHNGCFAEQNGERRLYVCGALPNGTPTISSRGGQAVLDVAHPFTTLVRYRKVFKPGFNATVGCPTVYFSNPMGTAIDGTLSLTASYVKDFKETRAQTVTLPPTEFQSRIDVGVHTFEGISSADVSVLDLVLSMRYEGTPYESPVTPTVYCVVVPFTTQEPRAQ